MPKRNRTYHAVIVCLGGWWHVSRLFSSGLAISRIAERDAKQAEREARRAYGVADRFTVRASDDEWARTLIQCECDRRNGRQG